MTNVGPLAHRGRDISIALAQATQGRRDHCPKCERTTAQTMEINDHMLRPSYNYRCAECQCIVETGNVLKEGERKVRRAREL